MTDEQADEPDWEKHLPAWVRDDRPMTEAEWLTNPHLYYKLDDLADRPGTARRLRLFASACCRRAWDLLPVPAARRLVELSEAYADGAATDADLDAANHSPDFATLDALYDRNWSGEEIRLTACVIAALQAVRCLAPGDDMHLDLTLIVQNTTYRRANDFVRASQNYQIGRSPGRDEAEFAAAEHLLRDIFGNPFRTPPFSPEWRTATARALAGQIYESRDFDAMPILADALQDAGCDDAEILDHCRGDGPHVRGCWVVDRVLGKE